MVHLRSHRRKKQSSPAVASKFSWCCAKSVSLMGMACAWLMLPLCCMARRSCSCTARQHCQIRTTYPGLLDVHHWTGERMADAPNLQARQYRLLSKGICVNRRLPPNIQAYQVRAFKCPPGHPCRQLCRACLYRAGPSSKTTVCFQHLPSTAQ